MDEDDDLWSQAPRIIPVVGGPADGFRIVRPSTGRLEFPGLGPRGRTTVTYTVRRFLRAGATVEVLVHGDAPVDPAFVARHALTPAQ